MNKIRNAYIRETVWRENTRGKTEVDAWTYTCTKEMYIGWEKDAADGIARKEEGKWKRGRPKRRFMDVVKEDMAEVEVTEDDTEGRNNWRCGDADGKSRKK